MMAREMHNNLEVFDLAQAATADRARVGGKAGVLGELVAAGFAVPPGLVVTADALDIDGWEILEAAARRLGAQRFAVRSSGAAEDLPDASYAGLYETYLNVPVEGLGEAVRRCSPPPPPSESRRTISGTVAARPGWRSWCRRW